MTQDPNGGGKLEVTGGASPKPDAKRAGATIVLLGKLIPTDGATALLVKSLALLMALPMFAFRSRFLLLAPFASSTF